MLESQASTRMCAGPLTLRFDSGDLRYLTLNGREVIRRIYAAVRDRNWGTVPYQLSDLRTEIAADRFSIRYLCTHRQNEIHFVWQAEILGESDGSIRFTFDGEAQSDFLRNRIGLCVLHPIRECAGARCQVQRPNGTAQQLHFPELIAPEQPVAGFHDLVAIAHEIEPGLWAELEFAGELFEMEDQRNWSDASFKTFSTPLRLPYPVEIKAGTRVRQEVRLKLGRWEHELRSVLGSNHSSISNRQSSINNLQADSSDSPVSITLSARTNPLPNIGLGVASHGQPLSGKEIQLLSQLNLRHLRCDLKLACSAWPNSLRFASLQAATLNVPLELAIHLPREGADRQLIELTAQLRALEPRVDRVLLFRDGEKTLWLASLHVARPHLAFLAVPIGAGTDANFYELNQFRPPHLEADFIHWSLNPQVHAFDLASLAETPAGVAAQLRSAGVFFPGKPLVVSPVTLKPRFNPVATDPDAAVLPDQLPPQVDPSQLSPFGAAWTLAVLKSLAEGRAHSVTLFETTGWRGVLEREAGSPLPSKFPSKACQVFPLFYAIAIVNRFSGGKVILSRSSDSLRVESMALERDGLACLCLANMTGHSQKAVVQRIGRVIRHRNVPWDPPDIWRFRPQAAMSETTSEAELRIANGCEVNLEPYGLHWLEWENFD